MQINTRVANRRNLCSQSTIRAITIHSAGLKPCPAQPSANLALCDRGSCSVVRLRMRTRAGSEAPSPTNIASCCARLQLARGHIRHLDTDWCSGWSRFVDSIACRGRVFVALIERASAVLNASAGVQMADLTQARPARIKTHLRITSRSLLFVLLFKRFWLEFYFIFIHSRVCRFAIRHSTRLQTMQIITT